MDNNTLNYISLLQEFCIKNNFFLLKSKYSDDYFQLSEKLDSSYENITHKSTHLITVNTISSLGFNSSNKLKRETFFDFLNEKSERWNLFIENHPLSPSWIFDAIQEIPDKFFYSILQKNDNIKFHSLTNQELSNVVNKARNLSFPFNSLLLSEFLLNFKSSFSNDALVVSLVNLTFDLPDNDKMYLYKSLGLSKKFQKIDDDEFLNESSTLTLSFDKIKLLGYLTNYSTHEPSLITKDVVWFEIQNITEFFNKPKSHNTKFIHGAISGGYNNQETSFKLHIDLSDMSQKEMIKAFVKKAICDLVEKNLDNTKTKDKKEHLKKLFNYSFLDNKLEIKNNKIKSSKL